MKLSDLSRNSLKAIGRNIGLDVQMVEGHLLCTPLDPDDPRYSQDFVLPSMKMIDACRADDFDFFLPLISAGKLSVEQMHRAAQSYYLGKTRSGLPIFWMIDDMLSPLDAHIGSDSWISTLLKAREPLLQHWRLQHCLFGLHLLCHTEITEITDNQFSNSQILDKRHSCSDIKSVSSVKSVVENMPIAIVESEASAVVLSELFPESLWLAYVSATHLDIELFAPLQGRNVTIFPRTDPTLSTYLFFDDLATSIRRHYDIHLTVSSLLEDHATDSQKSRCIDLLDFLLEGCDSARTEPCSHELCRAQADSTEGQSHTDADN